MAELPFFAGEEGRAHILVLLFFISVSVVTVWGTWQVTLPGSDEAVLAETAREIRATGDIGTMHFDGAPVYDTPPLVPWLMAAFYAVFGVNEFTARFPFVLLSVLTFYLVYLAGSIANRDRGDAGESRFGSLLAGLGFLSAIIMASSPLFGRFAPHITLGVPFAFFTAIALLGWLSVPARPAGAILWGVGVAGALLCFGAGGFLLVIGAMFASIADPQRRAAWRSPGFIAATLAAVVVGGLWLLLETVRGGQGFMRSPLWAPLAAIVHPSARALPSVLAAAKNTLLRDLPWSVPAVLASVRIVFFRGERRRAWWVGDIDTALFVFAAVVFFPVALTGPTEPSSFLAALPFGAILSAREIARWFKRSGHDATRGIWTVNHVMTALFCLLMLLLVATPLHLRSVGTDPIREIARMANRLTPEGTRVGNFKQRYREQGARMLFYGNRPLEAPRTSPGDVAAALEENPRGIFLSSIEDMEALRKVEGFPIKIRVLYGSGDLVLFGAQEAFPEEAP